jgi:hypothetical protein
MHMQAISIRIVSTSSAHQTQDIAQIGKLVFVGDEVQLVDKSGQLLAKEALRQVRQITFVDVATDIDSMLPSQIVVYPNPSHDILFVKGIDVKGLRVYDLQGRLLLAEPGNQITVSTLPVGTYLLQVGTQVVRFIKQ